MLQEKSFSVSNIAKKKQNKSSTAAFAGFGEKLRWQFSRTGEYVTGMSLHW